MCGLVASGRLLIISHMSPSGGSCTVRVRRLRLGTWVCRLPKGLELGLLGVLPLLIQLVRLGREQTLLGCKQASKRVSKQASKRVSKRVSKRMSKYVRKYVRKVRSSGSEGITRYCERVSYNIPRCRRPPSSLLA